MNKLIKIIILIAILIAVIIPIKIFLLNPSKKNVSNTLISTLVKQDNISTTISATGTLEPVDQVEVGTQVSGDISKIYVDYNSKVKQGEIIAELDKSKLQATLEKAEIALHSAEIDYEYKTKNYNRTLALKESNSASAVDLEQAEYNMNTAKLALERSQNEVDEAKLNLSYATIKSPINGVVLERAVDVGQTVAASMSAPTLFVIAKDLKQMKVMADVDEADIGAVKKGQKVTFTVDAFPNETFTGKVQEVRLNPTTTSNVVTYTVVINAKNPKLKLLPGMTATCTIITKEEKNVLSIPIKALKFSPSNPSLVLKPEKLPPKADKPEIKKNPDKSKTNNVWININGRLLPRPVKIGINDGVNVQVLEGLDLGDSVVLSEENLNKAPIKKEDATSPFMPVPPGKNKKK